MRFCTKLLWCFILKILVCAIMLGFHKSSRDTAKNSQNKIKIKLKMKLNHYNKTLRPEKHEGDQLYHWYWPTAPMQVWSTEMNIDCFNNGKGQAHLNPRQGQQHICVCFIFKQRFSNQKKIIRANSDMLL